MRTPHVKCAGLTTALLLGGCATLGTNIESNFSCRAPKGECAPSRVIDDRATGMRTGANPALETARIRAGIQPGDTSRTGDRVMKIVFPAHVDESGILHDEAIAYAVVEQGDWKAAARTGPQPRSALSQIRGALKAARANADAPVADPRLPEISTSQNNPLPLVSRSVLPSTTREAISGAHAPAIEGLDMFTPWHSRAPRSEDLLPPIVFPTQEAITAARQRVDATTPPSGPLQPPSQKAPR